MVFLIMDGYSYARFDGVLHRAPVDRWGWVLVSYTPVKPEKKG